MKRQYLCGECNEPVSFNVQDAGTNKRGLGTARCQNHQYRQTAVNRDLSGGKEANRDERVVPIAVRRHTLVVVRFPK